MKHPNNYSHNTLRVFDGLAIDADRAVTEVFAWVGRRGAGKSYGAGVLVEELLRTGKSVIVVDVVGTWWGLRVGADGSPNGGYRIPILGGDHADVDIVPEGGAIVATMLAETGSSAVLDLSNFRKGARQRFLTDWAEEFFHCKKSDRSPVHIVLEEAHTLVPQRVNKGQERMLGALEDLVRLGRNYGIGVSMLDQRPQSVNKDVLNQAEVLCAFQLVGAQERDAVKRWAEAKEVDDKALDTTRISPFSELARIPSGECILWSPEWLQCCRRVQVATKRTFDASATPGAQETKSPRAMLEIDLDALKRAMDAARAPVVESAQKKPSPPGTIRTVSGRDIQAVDVLTEEIKRLTDENAAIKRDRDLWHDRAGQAVSQLLRVQGEISVPAWFGKNEVFRGGGKSGGDSPDHANAVGGDHVRSGVARATGNVAESQDYPEGSSAQSTRPLGMSKMAHAMLIALAQRADLAKPDPAGLTKRQILTATGYASSGPVSKTFAEITRKEWARETFGTLYITPIGMSALGDYEPLPTGHALFRHLISDASSLSTMEKNLLRVIKAHPGDVSKQQVLRDAKYASSGPVSTAFGRLITMGYVTSPSVKYVAIAPALCD